MWTQLWWWSTGNIAWRSGKVLVPVLECVPLEKVREVLHQVDQIVRNGENIEKALDIVDNGILKIIWVLMRKCVLCREEYGKMQHKKAKEDKVYGKKQRCSRYN